jgi:hypothetical protein
VAGKAPPKTPAGGKIKLFNMLMYKGQSLGEYVRTILFFGMVDSYSTQPVRQTLFYCRPLIIIPSG